MPDNTIDLQTLRQQIDRSDPVPVYLQLAQGLENLLTAGHLQEGDRLPGDEELGDLVGLNVGTVSKAYAQLVDKGLVERRRRAGTFVRENAFLTTGNVGFYYFRDKELTILELFESCQHHLAEHNFDLKLIPFDVDFFDETELITDVRRRDLSGAIFTVLPGDTCRDQLEKLKASGFPFVCVTNRYFEHDLDVPLVTGADAQLLRDGIAHLRAHGHERIGFITSDETYPEADAYRDAMRAVPGYRESWLMPVHFQGWPRDWANLPGPQLVRGYLHENPELTAILVYHPAVCETILAVAPALERQIPQDLSLICLHDWSRFGLNLELTAYTLCYEKIGSLAIDTLLRVIAGKPVEHLQEVQFDRIDRQSVAPAPTT